MLQSFPGIYRGTQTLQHLPLKLLIPVLPDVLCVELCSVYRGVTMFVVGKMFVVDLKDETVLSRGLMVVRVV